MRKSVIFLFVIFLCSSAVVAKPKIAVMDIHDRSNKMSKDLLENATEMIRGKLSATGQFMVIDRSSQQEKMKQMIGKEKKESYNQNYDKESQIPLGRALAADSILRSTISCLGNDCMLSAEIVDIAREVSTKGGTSKFIFDKSDLSSLIAAIEDVVEQMADMSKGELSSKPFPQDPGNDVFVDPNASFKIIFDASDQAEVYVDGARVCKSTPCQQYVGGGMHQVKMVSRKMAPQEESIKFYRDERIIFNFAPAGAGVTITPVTVKGKTITDVSVYSGRNVIGTLPGTLFLTPESNKIVLKRAGFQDHKMKVNVTGNFDLNLSPIMEFEKYRPYKGGAIAGFVVGGILFVAGGIGYLVAETMDALGEDADTAFIASYSLLGIGVGGIVLGAVLISIKRPVPGAEGFALDVSGNGAKVSYTYKF